MIPETLQARTDVFACFIIDDLVGLGLFFFFFKWKGNPFYSVCSISAADVGVWISVLCGLQIE